MLSIVKSFEVLPKHSKYDFILEPFALNLYIFVIFVISIIVPT